METSWILLRSLLLTVVALVGFYAGLNLTAWFMVFCFVRETKQLTLEELDRKYNFTASSWSSIPS